MLSDFMETSGVAPLCRKKAEAKHKNKKQAESFPALEADSDFSSSEKKPTFCAEIKAPATAGAKRHLALTMSAEGA